MAQVGAECLAASLLWQPRCANADQGESVIGMPSNGSSRRGAGNSNEARTPLPWRQACCCFCLWRIPHTGQWDPGRPLSSPLMHGMGLLLCRWCGAIGGPPSWPLQCQPSSGQVVVLYLALFPRNRGRRSRMRRLSDKSHGGQEGRELARLRARTYARLLVTVR